MRRRLRVFDCATPVGWLTVFYQRASGEPLLQINVWSPVRGTAHLYRWLHIWRWESVDDEDEVEANLSCEEPGCSVQGLVGEVTWSSRFGAYLCASHYDARRLREVG